jgi:hypothetical protein
MSKVKNITKNLVPCLSRLFNEDLKSINNSWYLDNNQNLYKIKLFEDGYMISSDSEYPENLESLPENNSFKNINIYLEKVNRNNFVSDNKSLFKFSFNIKTSIYHYILKNLSEEQIKFTDFQLDSRKRKRTYSEDYSKKDNKKNKVIDWSKMVSASRVRNYLLNDTLIDWLNEYNITSINQDVRKTIPNSSSSISTYRENDNIDEFTKHIMDQGITFEKEVMKLLNDKIEVVQASESFQAKEIRNFDYTIKLMKDGVPVIYQAVLHDYENQTYGCPDIIVRSDYVNSIFNQELLTNEELNNKSLILGKDYYYVVIDIKHSTLHFNVDFKTLRNKDSVPAYKGQLYIYNEALAKMQGYNPNKAFILGKMWSWRESTGTNFMEKLGVIDYNDFDSNYVNQTRDAIKWILRVRSEGHLWKLSPIPSIPELYPNMNNERDGQWRSLKNELSNSINEITALWMCGIKNRLIAHSNNITSFKDPECCSELLGFKSGKISKTLDQIIDINRSENLISPEVIKTEKIGDKNWRTMNEDSLEFYLDYETMNSNLGHIIVENDNVGYRNNQFIFQIGLGYIRNNKWVYKSFLSATNDISGEFDMIKEFWKYVEKIKMEENKKECHFVHWYSAEPISYKKLQHRIKAIGSSIPDKNFVDLYKLFREEPITINGSLNFSLKSIAKAMNKNKLIKTSWDSTNPCSNGLNAMLLAHKAYSESKKPLTGNHVIMHNIIHYNQVDCKVLWEILSYLRENQ